MSDSSRDSLRPASPAPVVGSDMPTLVASGLFDRPCRIAVHGCSLAAVAAICTILLDPRVGQLIGEGDCRYLYRPLRSGWKVTAGTQSRQKQGRLPRIRPRIGEIYRPTVLTLTRLRALRRSSAPGELDLDRLLSLLGRELSRALGEEIDVEAAPPPSLAHGLFAAVAHPLAAVEDDLRRVTLGWWRPEGRAYIRWHAAVRGLVPTLRAAYGMMAAAERVRFDAMFSHGYLSAFTAMPDVTAATLLAFRDAGALEIEALEIAPLEITGGEPAAGHDFTLRLDADSESFPGALADLRRSLLTF